MDSEAKKFYDGIRPGRCHVCPYVEVIRAQENFMFLGCRHEPYRGKWVAEIEECPKKRRTGMNIYKEIGETAILEMLAEECAELAQAALKLARIQRGENPARTTEEEERGAVICEIADVENALAQLLQASWIDSEEIGEVMHIKNERWRRSIQEAKEEKEKNRGYQI